MGMPSEMADSHGDPLWGLLPFIYLEHLDSTKCR